jgi:transposase
MSSAKPDPLTIPPELDAEMTPAVRVFVLSLLERIRKLEARLGKNPQNSSLPPSTQHPHARPQPPKRKSKKRRGGQTGHLKHERPLIPSEDCDTVTPLKPTECRRCGEKLKGSDPAPLRHQVWELPEIKPIVTEYQRRRVRNCPSACRRASRDRD